LLLAYTGIFSLIADMSKIFLLIALVGLVAFAPVHAERLYIINGATLKTVDSAAPATVLSSVALSGVLGQVRAIDVRPTNNQLYGVVESVNNSTDLQLVRIDTNTGVMVAVGPPIPVLLNNNASINFDPVADRLRLVNTNNQNLAINPDTAAVVTDTTLAFAAVDPNFGVLFPSAPAVAYNNSVANAVSTTLFVFRPRGPTGILATQTPPASGQLFTVGNLGIIGLNDTGTSFDISGATGTAYGIPRMVGPNRLYTVNLVTGAATQLGDFGATQVFAMAVAPALAAAPTPTSVPALSSWVLLAAMLLLACLANYAIASRRPHR